MDGSDDNELLATLKTDGSAAGLRLGVPNATPRPPRRTEGDRALYFAKPAHEDSVARLLRRRPTRSMLEDDDN